MEWTVRWTGDREGPLVPWLGTVVGGVGQAGGESTMNSSPTNGPRLVFGPRELGASGIEMRQFG